MKHEPHTRKTSRVEPYDYEEPLLIYERPEFIKYVEMVEKLLHPTKKKSIGDMKRELGKAYRVRYMQDALKVLSAVIVEHGVKPTRYTRRPPREVEITRFKNSLGVLNPPQSKTIPHNDSIFG